MVLLERHLRLAVGVEARVRAHAHTSTGDAAVVGEPHAVPHGELAPVVGVDALLDLVRAADRARGAQLVHPLRAVDGLAAGPRGDADLFEEAHGVLAQPPSGWRV